jgi:hypothetical protein
LQLTLSPFHCPNKTNQKDYNYEIVLGKSQKFSTTTLQNKQAVLLNSNVREELSG